MTSTAGRPRRHDGWACKGRRQVRPVARSSARQGQVRLERPSLWRQPAPLAFRFDVSRKLAGLINPRDDLEPDDANQPAAIEGP